MAPMLIWLAFVTVVALLCVLRPGAGRIFVGLFFWLMAIGVNLRLAITNPQSFVDFVNGAYLGLYRDWFAPIVAWSPRLFALATAGFELVVGGLILGRGRAVKVGLAGAILFLLGITPLGKEELPNPVLAAGLAYLLNRTFDRTAREVLRTVIGSRRRRWLA